MNNLIHQCRKCSESKPADLMAKGKSICKACENERQAAMRRAKGAKEKPVIDKQFLLNLSAQHGIDPSSRRILGRLCEAEHRHEGLEYSLRMVDRHGMIDQCIRCKCEYAKKRNQTPEAKALLKQWDRENVDRKRLRAWLKRPRISLSVAELVEREQHRWVKDNRYWLDSEYKERSKQNQKKRYYENHEHQLNRVKVYKHSNPAKVAKWGDKRQKIAAKAADGTLTRDVVGNLFTTADKCPYCDHKMTTTGEHRKSLDHLTPLSKGGWHSIHNVAVCCLECNMRKGARTFDEWCDELPIQQRAKAVKMYKRITGGQYLEPMLPLWSGVC